jgi:hypothetical protein
LDECNGRFNVTPEFPEGTNQAKCIPKTDDDNDGGVSMIEFNKHRPDIVNRVRLKTSLIENGRTRELQGILLSPSMPHTKKLIAQITVMDNYIS